MREDIPADSCRRCHGKVFSEPDAKSFLCIENIEQNPLFGMVGTGRISWSRPFENTSSSSPVSWLLSNHQSCLPLCWTPLPTATG